MEDSVRQRRKGVLVAVGSTMAPTRIDLYIRTRFDGSVDDHRRNCCLQRRGSSGLLRYNDE